MLLIKTAEITHLHRFPCLNVLCILIRIHISKTHFYAYILYMSVTAATLQVNKSACMMHPFSDKHFKHCYCFACGESYKLKYCISSVFFFFFLIKVQNISSSFQHLLIDKTTPSYFYATAALTFINKPTSKCL